MIPSYITMVSWIRFFVVFLIVVATPSWASEVPKFTLSDDIKSQSVSTLHWADASKVATPSEAKAALVLGEFIAAEFTVPSRDASHWFALTLTNPTDHAVNPTLYIKQVYPSIVNLHYQQQLLGVPEAKWVSLFSGTDIPLKQRMIRTLSPTFALTIGPHQEQTYYLEIHSKIKLFRVDIHIGDEQSSSYIDQIKITILNMFIGAALALSITNILMYLSFRDKLYLYFSAYTASFILTVTFNNGLDLYFWWPISDRSTLYLSYNFVAIFFTLFVGEVLNAKHTMPWFNTILKFSRVIAVIMMGFTWFDGNFFFYTIFFFFPLSIFILGVAVYAYISGKTSSRLLLVGLIAFLVGVVIAHLTNLGVIPLNFVFHRAVLFGALIQMLIFSVVLFRRVISLSEDKQAVSLALLDISKEAQIVLEKTVNERTLELQKATLSAEKANHAKGEFLATINHEMRTLLSGILGIVEILQGKPSASEQERYVSYLDIASRQLSGLINKVLDFSKVAENVIIIKGEDFSSASLIQDLTGLFSLSAKKKGIAFTIEIEDEVSEWLHGDMLQLKQVLTNLISNALKFTDQGEVCVSIGIGKKSEDLSEDKRGGHNNLITFEVSDTGCGMTQAQLEHIFTPYYQIDGQLQISDPQPTKLTSAGTGLGLAISEGLVKAMGGSILATSYLGQGSRFSFTLLLPSAMAPLNELSHLKPTSETLDEARSCFTDTNILLVEDSPIIYQIMTVFLQETGANVSICETGDAAIKHFKDCGANIILMDYRLPDIDGLAVTRAVRTHEHHLGSPECPIIMHTADKRKSLKDEAQSVRICQILPKPFTQAQLIHAIRQALEKNSSSVCVPLRPNTNPNLIHLLDEFVDQNLASVMLCMDYLITRDFRGVSEELHKCKGNAGLFGADELYKTVLDMEEKLVAAPYDVDAINTLLAQAKKQLNGYHLWFKKLN